MGCINSKATVHPASLDDDDEGTVRAYGREGRGSCTRGVPIWRACIFFFFVLFFFLLMLPSISVVPCFKNIVLRLHFKNSLLIALI